MSKAYNVLIQGWGDDEDEFYSMGVFTTLAKAEAQLEKCLQGWEEDGEDRADVVYTIEEFEIV
jgi:hypothetical protein